MATMENRIHNGRMLTGYTDDAGDEHIGWPQLAHESIRAINHLTFGGVAPAPLVYQVLGELKGVGQLMPQALEQLADGLSRSLEELDVYDRARAPQDSVSEARRLLAQAADHARLLGAALETAQSTLADQGYHQEAGDAG